MKVDVVKYDPRWITEFNSEKLLLNECLGNLVEAIHHIGSTSVPNLAAKPIIDIIIEVSSLDALDKLSLKMESLGYEVKGEFGIPGRRYYRKGGDNRSHQVHAFKTNDANIKRHIAFRDYLKSHLAVMQEYADLKKTLAVVCNGDIERYCGGKNEFVRRYEFKALKWINEQ